MPEWIRVVVVDDEAPARRRIVELLDRSAGFELAGQFGTAAEALAFMERAAADVIFLDVQMPEIDGFGLLERLPPEKVPVTVFVTAYDRFALRAFEAQALDYLLKPFSDERFEAALARARDRVFARERAELGERVQRVLASRRDFEPAERLAIRSAGRVVFLDVSEIDWIEAAGVYVTVHAGERDLLARESLSGLEEKLDPNRFARIHRSAIVALDRVKELRFDDVGACRVLLADGRALKLSRRYRDALEARLVAR